MVIIGPRRGIVSYPLAAAASDPLAGFTWHARLQTNSDFGATPDAVIGLYQDTACTIPADEEFDDVAAIRGEFATGTVTLTQAVAGSRGFVSIINGKPVVQLDGVDDFYEITVTLGASWTLFLVLLISDVAGNGGVFGPSTGVGTGLELVQADPVDCYMRVAGVQRTIAGDRLWGNGTSSVTMVSNGATLSAANNGTPVTLSDTTAVNLASETYAIGRYAGSFYSEVAFAGLLISLTELTAPQKATVNTYLAGTKP